LIKPDVIPALSRDFPLLVTPDLFRGHFFYYVIFNLGGFMRYILTFLSLFLAVACNANVLIVVDDILWKDSSVKEAVKTYASDIEKARGVNVKIESFPAAKSGSTPEYLKSVLVKNKD
jgi:hypothetical protein